MEVHSRGTAFMSTRRRGRYEAACRWFDSMHRRKFLTAVAAMGITPLTRAAQPWRAGSATLDITPDRSLWLAGFAARTEASQGVALPLHAKALALKCGNQPTAVLVTADLLGVTARITERVASIVQR